MTTTDITITGFTCGFWLIKTGPYRKISMCIIMSVGHWPFIELIKAINLEPAFKVKRQSGPLHPVEMEIQGKCAPD